MGPETDHPILAGAPKVTVNVQANAIWDTWFNLTKDAAIRERVVRADIKNADVMRSIGIMAAAAVGDIQLRFFGIEA